MTDITKEMQKLITESLPAATAGAMTDFIKEAKKTIQELDDANDLIANLISQKKRMEEENLHLNNMLEKQEDLNAREARLADETENLRVRERDINLEIANVNLYAANDRNATVERLVDKVFGHPSVTVSTYKDVVVPVEGGSGCAGYAHKEHGVSESHTTTQTKA